MTQESSFRITLLALSFAVSLASFSCSSKFGTGIRNSDVCSDFPISFLGFAEFSRILAGGLGVQVFFLTSNFQPLASSFLVVLPRGSHPFPSRTRKLSL